MIVTVISSLIVFGFFFPKMGYCGSELNHTEKQRWVRRRIAEMGCSPFCLTVKKQQTAKGLIALFKHLEIHPFSCPMCQ